jgi:hypothetical protein
VNGRPKVVAILLLVVTFAVGSLTGMAFEEALGIDWFEFLDKNSDDPENRLLAGIVLSSDQQKTALAILERQEDRLENYWESRIPEIQGILQQTYAEIRVVLTPEQQLVFDRKVEALRGRVPAEIRD